MRVYSICMQTRQKSKISTPHYLKFFMDYPLKRRFIGVFSITFSGVGEGGRGAIAPPPPPTFWTCLHPIILMKKRFLRAVCQLQYQVRIIYETNVEQLNQFFLPQIAPKAVSEHENTKNFLRDMPPDPPRK